MVLPRRSIEIKFIIHLKVKQKCESCELFIISTEAIRRPLESFDGCPLIRNYFLVSISYSNCKICLVINGFLCFYSHWSTRGAVLRWCTTDLHKLWLNVQHYRLCFYVDRGEHKIKSLLYIALLMFHFLSHIKKESILQSSVKVVQDLLFSLAWHQ